MDKENKIIGKNAIYGLLGITPLGSIPSAIMNSIIEIKESKDSEKAQEELQDVLTDLAERIAYLEKGNIEESDDEILIMFNNNLTNEEFEKFVELFNKSDIPLDSADMHDGNSGIDIHLDEKISGYEIYKAKEKMDKLLKEISPDLGVEIEA